MLYQSKKGRYSTEYQQLWEALVPESGQADTVQGELVRAIGRLASEFYRNGNGNWDRGFRMFTDFLAKHLSDKDVFSTRHLVQIKEDIRQIQALGSGDRGVLNTPLSFPYENDEDAFDRVTDRVVEWCGHYPDPIKRKHNPKLTR